NLPTGEDKKNPPLDVKVKPSFKRTNVWKHGKIYYNETVEVADDYYDSLEMYGVNTKEDEKIPYITSMKEVSYKDTEVHEDYSNTYDVALTFDGRYLEKVMNRLSFYHFSNLKKYIPLLRSREEFLGEQWLNIFNRTIYVTIPLTMDSSVLTPMEKLNILERYFLDVSKQIKAGFSKERGTGKFIGYPIKEYISNYKKRVPKYDTGKFMKNEPQNVQRYELKEDYFVYDSAIINNTEKQLIDRIAERVEELEVVYDDVYLIRMDENMHRESAKNNKLKLHQFGGNHDEVNPAGFQPDFILYLQGTDYFIQIFIEPKGRNIEEEQWKEDLLTYINEHEAEIIFEDETDDVKIKGVKFYTMNDGRGAIRQIGEIALGKAFKGLSVES
ncbi:MAG TPA: restriction endonuclease, partial [Pseudogracilibacillus sp.]|nr:restriction endonuclease [Pseudogracilibacillus sp.]